MKNILPLIILLFSLNAYAQVSGEGLVINEFMASNDSTAMDPAGDYDDWIELFNTTEDSIYLSGFFISDKEDNPSKFEIPDSLNVTIAPLGYLIIWADEDGDKMQDGIHANFKLSGGGEAVVLSNRDTIVLDQVVYGEQTTDLSFARSPNGTGDFVIGEPTFNAPNDMTSPSDEIIIDNSKLIVFPNPNQGQFEVRLNDTHTKSNYIRIYNVLGKLISKQDNLSNQFRVNLTSERKGIYVLVINDRYTRKVVVND